MKISEQIREAAVSVAYPDWSNVLSDSVYNRFLRRDEFLSSLSGDQLRTFLLLVAEALEQA